MVKPADGVGDTTSERVATRPVSCARRLQDPPCYRLDSIHRTLHQLGLLHDTVGLLKCSRRELWPLAQPRRNGPAGVEPDLGAAWQTSNALFCRRLRVSWRKHCYPRCSPAFARPSVELRRLLLFVFLGIMRSKGKR